MQALWTRRRHLSCGSPTWMKLPAARPTCWPDPDDRRGSRGGAAGLAPPSLPPGFGRMRPGRCCCPKKTPEGARQRRCGPSGLKAQNLLQVVDSGLSPGFPDHVLETYRECLQDVLDVPGLREIRQCCAKRARLAKSGFMRSKPRHGHHRSRGRSSLRTWPRLPVRRAMRSGGGAKARTGVVARPSACCASSWVESELRELLDPSADRRRWKPTLQGRLDARTQAFGIADGLR